MHFSKREDDLLLFAQKCTGLDKTATMRLMMRRGIIDEIIKYRQTGVPKLPAELLELIAEF